MLGTKSWLDYLKMLPGMPPIPPMPSSGNRPWPGLEIMPAPTQPFKYGPQDKFGVAGVQNAIFGGPYPDSAPPPRNPMPASSPPMMGMPAALPPGANPPSAGMADMPPAPPVSTTSAAPPAQPDWWDRNDETLRDASGMLGALGIGMLTAPPGQSFGQGLGQGIAHAAQFGGQLSDQKLRRQLGKAQLGEIEQKGDQRKATLEFAKTIKDPSARTLMQMGLTAKAIERLEKIDPAEMQRVIDFEVAKQNALMPGKIAVAQAGRTSVNVNTRQETKFDETIGKNMADQYVDIQKGAQSARGKIATLEALRNRLADAGRTGTGAQTVLGIKRAAQMLGIDTGDLGPAEAAVAIGNQLALQLRNPSSGAGMPGAMSDKDREFLVASVPGLTKTPQGNAQLIDMMMKVEQRNIEVAQRANEYMRRNSGRMDSRFFDELGQWSFANPLFPQNAPTRRKWLGPGKWQ